MKASTDSIQQQIMHAIDLSMVGEYDRAKALLEPINDPLGSRFFLLVSALEQSARARSERQSELRHEIGNALAVVLANVEGEMDGILQPSPARAAGVHDALKTAVTLLDEWKSEAGFAPRKVTLHIDTFNVCDVIMAQVSMISGMALAKNVRVVCDPCTVHYEACVFFRGDQDRIGQILRNVLINAIRYTPPGGSVEIHCGRPHGELTLTVSDTGPGIFSDDMPHIFERAYRGKNVPHDGSGTGLAVSSELVRAIGGHIRVASEHQHGATFSIEIPATPLSD